MTADLATKRAEKPPKTFTIDGRQFPLDDREQTAAELLDLAGLDPDGYDLAELHGNGEPKRYGDTDRIRVQPGDRFVSIRQSAPVA